MTYPVFATGDVLNASDMNAVGLWQAGSGSFSAAASFDVTGFSADYSYYRLIFSAKRADSNSTSVLYAQLVNGATVRNTAYYASAFFTSYLGTTGVGYTADNAANFVIGFSTFTGSGVSSFDIFGVNSNYMSLTGTAWDYSNARQYLIGAQHDVSETNDKLRITPSAGTVTGSWRLYGYRTA